MIQLTVNGKPVRMKSAGDTPLLWGLREELRLTGTKYSCGIGECGACTVLLNGEPVLSCQTTLAEAANGQVTTIEGLNGPAAGKIKAAWAEEDVPQCGFCQPAQIITAASLLAANPKPDDRDIDTAMEGVLCRCGTYPAIKRAIKKAAGEGEA